MDGRVFDNNFIERLWRKVKYEEVYLKDYEDGKEALFGLRDYLRFYNEERFHQALKYMTPHQVYCGMA
jgi:putative transposase